LARCMKGYSTIQAFDLHRAKTAMSARQRELNVACDREPHP
jgi:hypothetical protein